MNVLLIEDNAADARLVRDQLEEVEPGGFHIAHAQRLSDGLARLRQEHFDAVLVDLGLPDGVGLEVLEPIHDLVHEIPVIVLSGRSDSSLAIQAVQSGAQDYLVKGQGDGALIARSLRYAIERKRSELRIVHLAHHDGLTDLPNRRLLMDRLRHGVARARRNGRMLAALFLDLDHFKSVNDMFGHAAGDQVLQEVATRLLGCVRESDTVARFAGDEFAVLLQDVARADDVQRVAEKIREALRAPMCVGHVDLNLSASIGVSLFPVDGDQPETLLRRADAAMYQAKQNGRDLLFFHPASGPRSAPERAALAHGLRRAIEQGELELHFQPRVDAREHRVRAVEALVRWRHPELGMLAPSLFVPLAEEMGLMAAMTEWVLRHACDAVRAWGDDHPDHAIAVSVNLSPGDLRRRVRAMVERTLAETGLAPGLLELELTETGMLGADDDETTLDLGHLRQSGVSITIDDFGTGHSSLSRLKRFPIDGLKIDRSFVRDLTVNPGDDAIVNAIITMGHGMRLRVTAEGVEQLGQHTRLCELGCDEIQGFLYGPPRPIEELESLIADLGLAGAR